MEKRGGDETAWRAAATPAAGICSSCRHHRLQTSRRGSVFHRCDRADEDDRFLRYPPIPVLRCPGHAPHDDEAGPEEGR